MKGDGARLSAKARSAIRAADVLLREGENDSAAGRAYYAMFYVVSALLAEAGMTSSKYSGVHAQFGEHFAKTGRVNPKFHRFLLDGFDRRVRADYGLEATVPSEEVALAIDQAIELLAEGERLLHEDAQ